MTDAIKNLNRATEAEQRCRAIAEDNRVLKERIAYLRSAIVATATGIKGGHDRDFLAAQAESFLVGDEVMA